MTNIRTRKDKVTPHYGFLVSWKPTDRLVKGESKISHDSLNTNGKHIKSADVLAQEVNSRSTKKDIIKSLILVSLILGLELVIYLAWKRLMP